MKGNKDQIAHFVRVSGYYQGIREQRDVLRDWMGTAMCGNENYNYRRKESSYEGIIFIIQVSRGLDIITISVSALSMKLATMTDRVLNY